MFHSWRNHSAVSGFRKSKWFNHLFKVESSNVVAPEVNYDLICISFPLVIRNNNVLIQCAYSGRCTHNTHTHDGPAQQRRSFGSLRQDGQNQITGS